VCCNTVITHLLAAINIQTDRHAYSVVVKNLRLKDEDKDKESSFKEDKDEDLMSKDEDLKIGPRGSSRTRTFIEDNTLL